MAYGARLESVLGASPRGFESPILRHRTPGPVEVPGFLLPVAPLVFRAPSGPATVCAAGRRPAREPSAPRASLGASSRSPAGPSGPSGTAAGPSGALHTGGTCVAWASPARPRHRPRAPQPGPPAPSTPAALVVLCAPAANWAVTALLSPGLVPLRLRGLRRSLHPGAQPGPHPSQRASSGAGPSRCSSIRPRTPSRSGAAMSRVRPPA